jgi:transcriptional regulator with XRE-family HTH domain
VSTPRTSKLDVEIGRRIRAHRVAAKLSQTNLAQSAGVTFQQIQKYEKGINRVAPGRLQKISDCLGISVAKFYPSLDGQRTDQLRRDRGELYTLLNSFGAVGMARSYAALRPACQIALRDLARVMASLPELRRHDRAWSKEADEANDLTRLRSPLKP